MAALCIYTFTQPRLVDFSMMSLFTSTTDVYSQSRPKMDQIRPWHILELELRALADDPLTVLFLPGACS
jgi:hypothetical protein